jgi:transcriptional regulator with XRE-family HTH domain
MGTKQDNPRSVLAKNLKALMAHGDLNQTALGKKAGVAISTIGRILVEKHAPDIDTLSQIAQALGVTAWQIMVPRLDPSNPPVLQNASPEERELYERLRAAAEVLGRKHQ